MLKRSLASAVTVAMLSGAIATPAQATTVEFDGNTCVITHDDEEMTQIQKLFDDLVVLPSYKNLDSKFSAEWLKSMEEMFAKKVEKLSKEQAKSVAKADKKKIEGLKDTKIITKRPAEAQISYEDTVELFNYINQRVVPTAEKYFAPYETCAAGKTTTNTDNPDNSTNNLTPTPGSTPKPTPTDSAQASGSSDNVLVGDDGKLTTGGIALAVIGSLTGVAILVAASFPFLAPLLARFLPSQRRF